MDDVLKIRRKNYNDPDHAHELTFSCYRQFPFLNSLRTCCWLAETIEKTRQTKQYDLWAYVFMPEHVHLLVHPRKVEYDIAEIRKAIKAPVAKKAIAFLRAEAPEWVPRITRQRGQRTERLFWQSGGGYDRNIIEPATLMNVIDYIHANPVRRELVERPCDWKWSSAAYFQEKGESPLKLDRIPVEWIP